MPTDGYTPRGRRSPATDRALLPLDQPWDTGTAVRLLVGLLVFAGVMVWQVRAIAGSRYPGLRAAEALGLIGPIYVPARGANAERLGLGLEDSAEIIEQRGGRRSPAWKIG